MNVVSSNKIGNESENNNELIFKEGAQVEVSIEEEGFRGSWYTATIIRPLLNKKKTTRRGRVFVEFDNLLMAGGSSSAEEQPLREFVDVILLRPIPPRESRRRFHVSEEVDAFHSDGWWEGIVMAVLDCGRRYSVFFRGSREQIVFPESQLRLHREWVHGNWVPPLEEAAAAADDDDDQVLMDK